MLVIKSDCKYYIGEKPCAHNRLCADCPHYSPWGAFILVIKTAALGDVLRTTSILPALKEKWPGTKVTWLTSPAAAPLLRRNPYIDEIVVADGREFAALLPRKFDLVVSLDKTPHEAGLASLLNAKNKVGVGLSESGAPVPLNKESEYYFSLGLSDELKFRRNEKTYGTMILEACGLPAAFLSPPVFNLGADEVEFAKSHLTSAGVSFDSRRIGLVVGAGGAFANKTPSPAKWASIIRAFTEALPKDCRFLLLGGPEDEKKLRTVANEAGGEVTVIPPLANVREYAAVLVFMNVIICGDTLAMHIAAALRVPSVVLFGPTCAQEIDTFGISMKIITEADCAPCYKNVCDGRTDCMDAVPESAVAEAAGRILGCR